MRTTSAEFLKKNNKKLFSTWTPGVATSRLLNSNSFLRSFFLKKRPLNSDWIVYGNA